MVVIFHAFFHTSTGHENSRIWPNPAIVSNKYSPKHEEFFGQKNNLGVTSTLKQNSHLVKQMHYIETCYTGKRGKWNQIFNLLFQVQFGWLLFAVGQ